MDNFIKIGILTFHYTNCNYGGILQTFSIYKLVESLGYDSYIVNYPPKVNSFRKKMAARIEALFGFEFEKFRRIHIPRILPETASKEDLKKLNETLDGFIVGSDQVWRYRSDSEVMFTYYLNFVNDDKLKIAYAASFGVDHWDADEQTSNHVKKLVQRFHAISVREKSGLKICREKFDVESINLLDPTLVLDKKYFHELADKKPLKSQNSGFIAYMLLDDVKQIESYFKDYAKGKKLQFFRIKGKNIYPKKNFYLFKSVSKWLSYIKYADLVVTDSFHCTVFSIIFRKKFVCIPNKHRGVTRLENLLKLIHLENRLIFDLKKFNEKLLDEEIDYQNVELLLSEEKNKSISFLKNSLKLVKT